MAEYKRGGPAGRPAAPPSQRQRGAGVAAGSPLRHGQDAHRSLRARRHRDRGRRGRDDPQRRLPAGHHAHARLQGGPVLGVQVVPPRRRGRPRPLLDVRAARLRGGRGLDAAVPRPPLLRPRDRADQLRRGDHPRRHAAADGHDAGRGGRGAHHRHPAAHAASADDEPLEFKPGPVRRHPRSRATRTSTARSRWPTPNPDDARVHDQALRGRAASRGLLADGAIKPGDELDVTGPYGVFTLRPSSPRRLLFIGGGAGMAPILSLLRSLPRRAASARRPTTTARAPRPTCSTCEELAGAAVRLRPRAVGGQQRLGGREPA